MEMHYHAPRPSNMHLGHGKMHPCALGICGAPQHAPWASVVRPKHLKCEGRMSNFIHFFVGLARIFSPNPVRNLHYK